MLCALASACDEASSKNLIDAAPGTSDAEVEATRDAGREPEPEPAEPDLDASVATDAGPESLARWRPIAQGLDVATDQGSVRGKIVGRTRAFLGIPYAMPPTGSLRFRPPQLPAARSGVFEATAFGKACPQALPIVGFHPNSSEDCLTLNIWTTDPAPASPLPVMVWIHGGAFQLGDGGGAYDGQKLSEAGGVVVVTLNYRLGALGFLAHPALSKESGNGSTGNYGIRDQQAALAWVRANISAFGGDAENVTVLGESAGGHSTCIHLAARSSALLFDRAIVQSGLCMRVAQRQDAAEIQGERFAKALGCPAGEGAAACLRGISPQTLVERSAVLNERVAGGIMFLDDPDIFFFQPTLDTEVFPRQLEDVFAEGAFNRVPVLHGANVDEGALFQTGLVGGGPIGSRDEFERLMGVVFAGHVQAISAMYSPPANANWREALSQATGDFMFVCPARRLAAYLHAAGVPNYLYRFAATIDSLLVPELSGRALHSADVPYLFGNGFELGWIPSSKVALQDDVMRLWTRFARRSDPNEGADAGISFPAYDPESVAEFNLDVPLSMRSQTKELECQLWRDIATAH